MTEQTYKGWKSLNPYGATGWTGADFVYPLPAPDEKWGAWIEHPEPAEPDGRDCGEGRLHQMKRPDARYAPQPWWPWYCEGDGLVGESVEKRGLHRLRLRRVPKDVWWRIIRLGWCSRANLREADLREADLHDAKLRGVILRGADLRGANLRGADLYQANLIGANLIGADLYQANLCDADLRGANLYQANLIGADLYQANLIGANLSEANLIGADLYQANLCDADLRAANLRGANHSDQPEILQGEQT